MCGICGFNWSDRSLINKMITNLKHRGPDDKGSLIDDNLSLGHTRLSIIDLSPQGKQPMHNEDNSIWIIFNGEIYNYKYHRNFLEKEGHKFYTETDTEVIIHLYEEFGIDCLSYLNGQFAFCIYDVNKNILFLSRDRFGIKPLYFYFKDQNFIFGSEIKSILQYDLDLKLNLDAVIDYLTFRYSLAPKTFFREISKLKPYHYLLFNLKTKEMKIHKYNDSLNLNTRKINLKIAKKELYHLLFDSVKLRMIADVPVACFLSGGIDSSILTGIASEFNNDINTFSVGFDVSNELKYARIVSDYFNTNHHELLITIDDVLKNIEKMIYHMDEPIGDPGFFPTLLISELASKYNKVVLAGEGSDEIFGGYDKYKFYYYGKFLSKLIPKINMKSEIINRLSNFSSMPEHQGYLETIRVFEESDLKYLRIKSRGINDYWNNKGDLFQKMQFFDLNTLMPEDFFFKADKMSSAYGLEERVPYMDYRMVNFALNLPIRLKLHLWNEKYILKKTYSNFLPKSIIKRRKRGYNVPIEYWFKELLIDRFSDLLESNKHQIYNKKYAKKLINRLKTQNKKNFYLSQKMWSLYIFEEWFNLVFN